MSKYLLPAMLLFLTACQEEELIYSCDPEMNSIVKSALIEYNQITLSEFLQFDIDFQRAVYRGLTPDKRYDFWTEKLDSALQVNNYNDLGKQHIRNLITELTPDFFDFAGDDTLKLQMKLDFIYNWTRVAVDHFQWGPQHIRYLLYSLFITEDQQNSAMNDKYDTTIKSLSTTCNCTGEGDCGGSQCDSSTDCNTQLGCGILWLLKCNGNCNI